jgi:predicted molibdopterin-dependent oxidoreductase YjgC
VTLLLDGHEVEPAGSLLDTILAAGIELPHLCKDDNLAPIGACRTCLVEADGRIVAACSLPAVGVTAVETSSDRARRLRRGVLALTLGMQSEPEAPGGPHSSETAETARREDAASKLAIRTERAIDATNPFFEFHEASCILCGRCVAACQHLQHISAIGMAGRGRHTRVTPGAATTFLDSVCTSCGSCVAACPTPALRPKGAAV